MPVPRASAVLCLVLLVLALGARADDWPQWRGPGRDGIVVGVSIPEKWPQSLQEQWRAEVGEGISSPVVVGGNVYLLTRQQEQEVVHCLDLATGRPHWKAEPYPSPYEPHPAAIDFGKRPRSTPAVAGGRVFTLGITGILSAYDARSGRLLWRKDYQKYPTFGASTSPLIVDELCIVHVGGGGTGIEGGLTAFDAGTGEVKWCYQDYSSPGYGSPILAELAGERQVITFTSWNLLGVSAATGKLLWKLPAPFDGLERCITPVLYKDLIIFAAYKERPRAIRLVRTAEGIEPQDVWQAAGHNLYMSTPVVVGERLFGMSDQKAGHFFCLDAESGQTRWQSAGRDCNNASLVAAGNRVLLLTNHGQLIVIAADAASFEPIAKCQVSDTQTWAHPVIVENRILIKDHLMLRSLRIGSGAGNQRQ